MKQFLSFALVFFNTSSTVRHSIRSTPNPVTTVPPKLLPTKIVPSPPEPLRSSLVCSGHGSFTCNCDQGYDGPNCETEINFCAEIIDHMNTPKVTIAEICKPYGKCISTVDGAVCVCQPGFTGEFCQTEVPDQVWTADRCALYDSNHVVSENITIGCPKGQHCVPDNMNCVVAETCDAPLGWCLPLGEMKKYADYFNKLLRL